MLSSHNHNLASPRIIIIIYPLRPSLLPGSFRSRPGRSPCSRPLRHSLLYWVLQCLPIFATRNPGARRCPRILGHEGGEGYVTKSNNKYLEVTAVQEFWYTREGCIETCCQAVSEHVKVIDIPHLILHWKNKSPLSLLIYYPLQHSSSPRLRRESPF
jgi:hypothetical protein